MSVETARYGDHASQVCELTRPAGESRGVVVVVHGGFWKVQYGLELGRPLAASLAERGWTAWNVEYRRVDPDDPSTGSGGYPLTLDDVAAAIDALADVPDLDLSTVVTLGHSAGGHLATWAASRGRFPRWQPERVRVTSVVSQAGVLDLRSAHEAGLGSGAVVGLLGHAPGPDDDPADPIRQVPLDVPVWCIHPTGDEDVPPSQSRAYVAAARAAGARAHLEEVDGDHYVVIDPTSDAWARTLAHLDTLG
ncbi:alpha/beta hydrolase [Nocardioides sp. GCM10027113]|uniref:alpha/beta hydrolase n=1 Tax=unclassified Nocardioides TaxID=2615069 RepID=UPI003614C761